MKLHLEVLSPTQGRVLAQLGPVLAPLGFYLTGGTALALHLGHRRSVDLDWFTSRRLEDPLRLARTLRETRIAFRTGDVAQGTLHGTVSGVRVSLIEYRYRLLTPLKSSPQLRCRLAGRADLAAMKLAAVAQRGAKKDFVDVYALNKRGMSLAQMLRCYRRKYHIADVAHVLIALAYFDEADRDRMPQLFWDGNWRSVKKTVQACLAKFCGRAW